MTCYESLPATPQAANLLVVFSEDTESAPGQYTLARVHSAIEWSRVSAKFWRAPNASRQRRPRTVLLVFGVEFLWPFGYVVSVCIMQADDAVPPVLRGPPELTFPAGWSLQQRRHEAREVLRPHQICNVERGSSADSASTNHEMGSGTHRWWPLAFGPGPPREPAASVPLVVRHPSAHLGIAYKQPRVASP
ncbi:hypothetical protein MRX96_035288 [Rhipicephalus microplus]